MYFTLNEFTGRNVPQTIVKGKSEIINNLHSLFQLNYHNGSIKLNNYPNNHHLFIDFRNSYGTKIQLNDEPYLIFLIRQASSQWFVGQLLSVMDDFSYELCQEALKAVIKFSDEQDQLLFLTPCIRVFGEFVINQSLIDLLIRTNNNVVKCNIIRAMARIKTRLFTIENLIDDIDGPEFSLSGFKFCWYKNKYVTSFYEGINEDLLFMNEDEIYIYKPMFDQLLYDKRKQLLKEYIFNNDQNVRLLIAQLLPSNVEAYDKRLLCLFKLFKKIQNNQILQD